MISKYSNNAAYAAAGYPASESRVSQIDATEEVKIDGVNVMVDIPACGDAVYHDGSRYAFFKGGSALNHSALVSLGYTSVGEVVGVVGKKVLVANKATSSAKYLNVWQYSITAISSTSITISLRMKGDYNTYVTTSVTLTSAAINSTTVAEINTALEAAGNTGYVGYANHGYWAYLADDNDNKVTADADATKIIIQCDFTADYRQYMVAGTGCTIALSVWGSMPASSNAGARNNNRIDSQAHLLNIARGVTYFSTNGATPSANVAVNASATPVTKTAFESSEYCADLRAAYGSYTNYIAAEYYIRYPQLYGVFGLPDAQALTNTYGGLTATLKNDTTVYKFPALHYAQTIGYGVTGISAGDWFLAGIDETIMMLNDDNMALINATASKMGATLISNSANRWLAQRYTVNSAWIFNGASGNLSTNSVVYAIAVQAVVLLDFEN